MDGPGDPVAIRSNSLTDRSRKTVQRGGDLAVRRKFTAEDCPAPLLGWATWGR